MDCNKDEAIRAKRIAENKYESKEFAAAEKFALRAQRLFPTLEGIAQLVTTLSIHVASTVKIAGDNDWYSILSLPISVDDEKLKKRYRELIRQVHPDKNKSVGADDACKLVFQAWKVLSDKQTRATYDQKMERHRTIASVGAARESYNVTANNSTADSTVGLTKQKAGSAESAVRQSQPQSSTPVRRSAQAPVRRSRKKGDLITFWTACNKCCMQYELYRKYLNINIRCPSKTCSQTFIAKDTQSQAPEDEDLGGGSNYSGANPLKRSEDMVDKNVAGASSFASAKKMRTVGKDSTAG